MPSFFLRPHVYACVEEDQIVFLDTRTDSYFCVASDIFSRPGVSLCGFVEHHHPSRLTDSTLQAAHGSLEKLLADDVITTDASAGKPIHSPAIERATHSIFGSAPKTQSQVRLRSIWQFARCAALISLRLRYHSFYRLVTAIRARKTSAQHDCHATCAANYERYLADFRQLRRYVPRPYLCLFDSLLLLEFFACQQLYPDWIFAVRLVPFEAHCWLQAGDTVLNDSLDATRFYTPVMSV